MTELIANAEHKLTLCLEGMRATLQATLEDALPKSTLPPNNGDDMSAQSIADDIPDTLLQRQEWEHDVERRRVQGLVEDLQQRFHWLRVAIMQLGGGVDPQGQLLDVPVGVLDAQIAQLSAESSRLGAVMVDRYAEAQELAETLEEEILSVEVPAL